MSDGNTDSADWDVKPTSTQWVKHFSGQGERYKVLGENEYFYQAYSEPFSTDSLIFWLPKGPNGYIPCPPPERWEVVPLDHRLRLNQNERSFCIPDLYENERFAIRDGALVLERKVEG